MKKLSPLAAIAVFLIVFVTSCKKEDLPPETEQPQNNAVVISVQPNYQSSVRLGFANNFALFAANLITSTGGSSVNGDIGISAGSLFLGFPKGSIVGAIEINSEISAVNQTINVVSGATVVGRLLSVNGSIELNSNSITKP